MRQGSACVSLLIQEGWAGYGVYMAILEILRDAPGFRYNPDPKLWAYILHGADVDLVKRVLQQYGLFDQDNDGLLFSPWLNDQLSEYSDKKTKLQEAGRRGAAKRWAAAHANNGQAIATPSVEDGQAIAYNDTQYNITEDNKTTHSESCEEDWRLLCQQQGIRVDEDFVVAMTSTQPEGHAPGYVAQVCCQYGIGQNVLDYLLRVTDNANKTDRRYKQFCSIVSRIQREHYSPQYPANFFCSKLAEIH